MNERLFNKLRARITELGADQAWLAKQLDVTPSTLSFRMTGKIQWLLSEMYIVMDLLRLPHERLSEYFPKDGKSPAVPGIVEPLAGNKRVIQIDPRNEKRAGL